MLRSRGFAAPIVILTASTDPGDERRCRAAGCDRFLSKPVDYDLLLEALAECIASRATTS